MAKKGCIDYPGGYNSGVAWVDKPLDASASQHEVLSFIIPTSNSERTIGKCLSSIPKHASRAEVIVVDNFSSDSTVDICRRHPVKVYQVKSPIARQRNYGAKHSRGRYIVRLDSDETFSKPLFDELVRELKRCEPDVVWAPVIGIGYWRKVIDAINDAHRHYFHGNPYQCYVPLAYKKKLFLRFPQDEKLYWYEDLKQIKEMESSIRNAVILKNPVLHLPIKLREIVKKRIRLHSWLEQSRYSSQMYRSLSYRSFREDSPRQKDALYYVYCYTYILKHYPSLFLGAILLLLTSTFLRFIKQAERWL